MDLFGGDESIVLWYVREVREVRNNSHSVGRSAQLDKVQFPSFIFLWFGLPLSKEVRDEGGNIGTGKVVRVSVPVPYVVPYTLDRVGTALQFRAVA